MDAQPQEMARNPPAFVSVALAAAAVIALAGLFKADWDLGTSLLTALAAAIAALVAAGVAVGWSIGKRGQGWLAASVAFLVSAAALGWVAWTFLLLVRASA